MTKPLTQPLPPGWYADPYGTDADRYFNGKRWTGRTRTPESPVPVDELPESTVRPRSAWVRGTVTAVAVAISLVCTPPMFETWWGTAIALAVLVVTVVFFLLVARRVSYRRRDVWMVVVPWFGNYLIGKAVWRLMGLPYRDWPPRPDEIPTWQSVRHASMPHKILYIEQGHPILPERAAPPVTAASVLGAPVPDVSVADSQVADSPVADSPATDAPVAGAPVATAPVVDSAGQVAVDDRGSRIAPADGLA